MTEAENHAIEAEDKDTYLVIIFNKNQAGMLAQFTKMFADNRYNIESLTIAAADIKNTVHRTTIKVFGNEEEVKFICNKVQEIDGVIRVIYLNMTDSAHIERETAFVKIKTVTPNLNKIFEIVSRYDGSTIYSLRDISIFMLSDTEEKVSSFLKDVKTLEPDAEIVRSGVITTLLNGEMINYDN